MHPSLRWLLPPLLGLGGYFLAASGLQPPLKKASSIGTGPEAAPPPASAKPLMDLGAELKRLDEEWERIASEQDQATQDALATVSAEESRSRILKLKAQLDDPAEPIGWNDRESIEGRIGGMLARLARIDPRGTLAWINEDVPSLRCDFMARWANTDPDAALNAVIASKHKPPCNYDTLATLLQARAAISPAALREASDKIPWHLLCGTVDDDPFADETGIGLPPTTDLRPWLESGTAEALARDGVTIDGLFALWGRQDPAGALARVEDWPGASPRSLLHQVLAADAEDRQVVDNITRALEVLPEDQLRRLTALIKGDRIEETILRFYPILHGSDDVSAPPE